MERMVELACQCVTGRDQMSYGLASRTALIILNNSNHKKEAFPSIQQYSLTNVQIPFILVRLWGYVEFAPEAVVFMLRRDLDDC